MALHRLPAMLTRHAARWLFTIASLFLGSCLGLDEGNLTEPPDGSHCPDEAPGWCDETCVDTASDVSHCGGCGAACEAPPQVAGLVCDEGACAIGVCASGFDDCDGEHENGCEADLFASKKHCGTCGRACVTECLNGACNDPIEVSAGSSYTCAIRGSGSVWCWGDNEEWSNLGIASSEKIHRTPQRVELPGPASKVATAMLAVRRHTCTLLESGAVYCWGANTDGQLGAGSGMASSKPLLVGLPDATTRIAVGGRHTCAVSDQSQLWCWGSNASGEIGLGMATLEESLPTFISNSVADVTLGGQHTCARQTNGTVLCWGANASGQLGNGTTDPAYLPLANGALAGAAALGLGAVHSCARFENGSMSCWGQGGVGQLGLGSTGIELTPQIVIERGVTSLPIGAASSSAIVNGDVWAWGLNADGQLGLGHTDPVVIPTKTTLGPVKQISLGDRHGCAIRTSGELVCWGANDRGQLGLGDPEPSLKPRPVVFPPEGPASQSESGAGDGAPEGGP